MVKKKNSKPRKANDQSTKVLDKDLKLILQVQREMNGMTAPTAPDISFPLLKRNKIYTFVRTYSAAQIVLTTTLDTTFAYAPALNLFPDYTEFTALFDRYRIGPTRVSFTSMENVTNTLVTSVVHTAIDYDDAVGATAQALQEYESHQINSLSKNFQRTFQPRAANAAYSGVFTSFAQMPPRTWIDANSPGVLYYGLKGQVPASIFVGGPYTIYDVQVTSILQFCNSR